MYHVCNVSKILNGYSGIGRAARIRGSAQDLSIKLYDKGSAVTSESAESGTPVICHTFTNISTVVFVHWLGNFASRVEQDGTLKMDFSVELDRGRYRRGLYGHLETVGDDRVRAEGIGNTFDSR